MLQPLYIFCESDPVKNLALLEQLVEEAHMSSEGDVMTVYEQNIFRASSILKYLYDVVPQSAADLFATQVISFLETPILEQLVKQKENLGTEDQETMARELFYIASVFNIEPDQVPYSPEEINAFLSDEETEEEMLPPFLACTVGYAMRINKPGYTALMRLLPTEPQLDVQEQFDWEDAFLLGVMIHLAWSFFSTASERDRIFILQHYLYRGIVLGVPVRAWLTQSFTSALPGSTATQYVQALLNSVELVPVDTHLTQSKKLSEVSHDFIAAAVRETIPTLAQEKYLAPWYGNTPEAEPYRAWLRDTLTIVYKLQTNTIHRV